MLCPFFQGRGDNCRIAVQSFGIGFIAETNLIKRREPREFGSRHQFAPSFAKTNPILVTELTLGISAIGFAKRWDKLNGGVLGVRRLRVMRFSKRIAYYRVATPLKSAFNDPNMS